MQSSPAPTYRQPLFWLYAVVLAMVIGAVFHRVCSGEFLAWDDDINITTNPHLQGSTLTAENLRWMFTDASYMRRYVPLAWLGWGIESSLTGLTSYSAHLGNVLLHGANALLILLIVLRVLPRVAPETPRQWQYFAAAGAASLWALHPMRVEVVAWASGRLYLQASFFGFVALLAYLEAMARPAGSGLRRRWFVASVLMYGVALLSYPIALSFPVLLLVVDWIVLGRFGNGWRIWRDAKSRTAVWEKAAYAVAAVVVLVVTLVARLRAQGLWEPAPTLADFSLSARVMQACYVWMYYLWRPLWPFGLGPVYTTLIDFDPWHWQFVASALGLVAISVLACWRRAAWPGLLVIWVGYLALLTPMLGVTERPHFTSDRYSYFAGLLIFPPLAVGLCRVKRAWVRRIGAGALALACIGCALVSVRQIRIWHDSESLFRFLREHVGPTPAQAEMEFRLAETLRGRARFTEALSFYEESLRHRPAGASAALASWGAGVVKQHAGQQEDALRYFQAAARLNPAMAKAHVSAGLLRNSLGQFPVAIEDFRQGLAIDPNEAQASQNLLIALLHSGRYTEAAEEGVRAVRLNPRSTGVRANWAIALNATGRSADAVAQTREALRVDPTYVDAFFNLGEYLRSTSLPESIAAFREALRIKPDSAFAHNGLGVSLAMAGQISQAVQEFEAATRANPDFALAYLNLGRGLRDLQRREEAKAALGRALQLNPGLDQARALLQDLQGN